MIRRFALALLCVTAFAGTLDAQDGARPRQGRSGRQLQQELQPGAPAERRQQLQQQVRRVFWFTAKTRIGFTDDQMAQLEATSRRFDQRRRALAQDERAERIALREQVQADSAADQPAIAASLDRLLRLQRQRVDLQADEMKELSAFTTPLQRAKFFALQEQVRKRVQELMRARGESNRRGPPPELP